MRLLPQGHHSYRRTARVHDGPEQFHMDEQPARFPFQPLVCGIHDLERFRDAEVSHVVSILDPGALAPDVLASFGMHERLDLRFHDIIDAQDDMVVPQREHIHRLLSFGAAMARLPSCKPLLHCHAGVSRSTAAAVLLLAQTEVGRPRREFAEVLGTFPNAWPNLRMIELGDELMGCEGALIAATRAHYAGLLERYPTLRSVITDRHLRSSSDD